uniref:Uncharacterized protein n=1 Tax=Varroa destructor TaxID=109461 RepID=A0A7M7L1S7_VARDE
LDSVGGGAWPFLVGGAICLVNSDNERDSSLLNRRNLWYLEGPRLRSEQAASSRTRLSNNRSVMPLDVLGRTRATLKESACFPWPKGPGNPLNLLRARDWGLQLFPMNEEFPVSASHKLALITSLPFVHTARRYYRLNDLVRSSDWCAANVSALPMLPGR